MADDELTAMRRLYIEAVTRYANDPEFHARAYRIGEIINAAEPEIKMDALIGSRIGAAVALHMSEGGIVEGGA